MLKLDHEQTLRTMAAPGLRILGAVTGANDGWDPTISRSAAGEGGALAPARAPAARIGRFAILRVLGEGGMGRVYVGYDEELDRKVAIKVLRRGAGDTRRLVREAQSLARLSHPNVVQVHEAGTDAEGQVFVAMELVAGQTLGRWAEQTEPDWRGRLEVLIQAGRGLEAAHGASLVHRDFKPDNVMVGEDGRVRVLDFGLARVRDGREDELEATEADLDGADEEDSDALTRRGSIMGTPAYMAPEQHEGQACDAASDQYAFCLTAYELLWEERPFGRGRIRQLYEAKRRGELLGPAKTSKVPRAVQAAIVRGLAPDPGERWPDMGALLDQLDAALGPKSAARRWPSVVGVAALGVVGLVLGVRSEHPTEACVLDADALVGVWDGERQAALEQVLAASLVELGRPSKTRAAALATEAGARLDAWGQAWTEARRDSCRATRIETIQSEAALDRRELCFARQRAELDALVGVLTRVDAELPARLPAVLETLPELGACSLAALEGTSDETLPPDQRAALEAGFAKLAEAEALIRLGRVDQGRELAEAVRDTGETLTYPALAIEARAVLADLETRGGNFEAGVTQLRAAALAARREGLLDLEASLRVQLARTVAGDFGRPMLEQWAIDEASALVDEVARPHDPRAVRLEVARARIAEQAGSYDEAIAAHERAYALAEGRLEPSARALLRIGVGTSHYRAGRYDEARSELEACLETAYATWGPWTPEAARIEFNLAMVYSDLGDRDTARAHMNAALELDRLVWGEDSIELARDRFASAYLDFGLGQMARGCAELEPLVPVYEAALGPTHDELGQLLTGVGVCRLLAEDDAGALAAYERALAIQLEALGEDHYEVGLLRSNIAEIHLLRGELDRAEGGYAQAQAIFTATLPEDHAIFAYPLRGLGTIALERGEVEAAVETLEHALEIADASDAVELAELRFALARALARRDPSASARALELAEAGHASLAAAGASTRAAVVRTWLDQHDGS